MQSGAPLRRGCSRRPARHIRGGRYSRSAAPWSKQTCSAPPTRCLSASLAPATGLSLDPVVASFMQQYFDRGLLQLMIGGRNSNRRATIIRSIADVLLVHDEGVRGQISGGCVGCVEQE